jgi:uncharacterized protein YegP (UPF0339 family)
MIIWRLVASNNRVLGMSAATFPAMDAALTAVHQIREDAQVALIELVHVPTPGQDWTWRMLDDGGKLTALSPRSYKRRIDCHHALERFRVTAPQAVVDSTVGRRGRFW